MSTIAQGGRAKTEAARSLSTALVTACPASFFQPPKWTTKVVGGNSIRAPLRPAGGRRARRANRCSPADRMACRPPSNGRLRRRCAGGRGPAGRRRGPRHIPARWRPSSSRACRLRVPKARGLPAPICRAGRREPGTAAARARRFERIAVRAFICRFRVQASSGMRLGVWPDVPLDASTRTICASGTEARNIRLKMPTGRNGTSATLVNGLSRWNACSRNQRS